MATSPNFATDRLDTIDDERAFEVTTADFEYDPADEYGDGDFRQVIELATARRPALVRPRRQSVRDTTGFRDRYRRDRRPP